MEYVGDTFIKITFKCKWFYSLTCFPYIKLTCYRLNNRYDFTYWTYDNTHPGNSKSRNPIKEIADTEGTVINFPDWHEMNRWTDNKVYFTEIGRLGDIVSFSF